MINMKIKKINFKIYDKLVAEEIKTAKHQYYFNTFTSHTKNM